MDEAGGDDLAFAVDHFLLGALDRAFEGDVLDQAAGMMARRIPCARECGAMRGAAEAIGSLPRHADRPRRDIDEASIGERLDEAALLLLGPAVEPLAAADGDPAIVGGVIGFGRRGFDLADRGRRHR